MMGDTEGDAYLRGITEGGKVAPSREDLEQTYVSLNQEMGELKGKRDRLVARLEVQREQRGELEKELRAKGIDTDRIQEERDRLEGEVVEHLTQAKDAVAEFAEQLDSALGSQPDQQADAAIDLT